MRFVFVVKFPEILIDRAASVVRIRGTQLLVDRETFVVRGTNGGCGARLPNGAGRFRLGIGFIGSPGTVVVSCGGNGRIERFRGTFCDGVSRLRLTKQTTNSPFSSFVTCSTAFTKVQQ